MGTSTVTYPKLPAWIGLDQRGACDQSGINYHDQWAGMGRAGAAGAARAFFVNFRNCLQRLLND